MTEDSEEFTFDPYGDSEDQHLAPSTSYTATISWDDGCSQDLHFSTSEVGGPVVSPQDLPDKDYFFDLSNGIFTQPPGIAPILGQYLADVYQVLRIVELDDKLGTADVFGAAADYDGKHYSQDLCIETVALTGKQPGDWQNPYLKVGPVDLYLPVEGSSLVIFDTVISASFAPDGSGPVGGTFDGTMDTRGADCLVDVNCTEGATCDLLGSLSISCEQCPDQSGEFCVTLSAFDVPGEQISITATDPETGEQYDHLVEVTPEMVEAWTMRGHCP